MLLMEVLLCFILKLVAVISNSYPPMCWNLHIVVHIGLVEINIEIFIVNLIFMIQTYMYNGNHPPPRPAV